MKDSMEITNNLSKARKYTNLQHLKLHSFYLESVKKSYDYIIKRRRSMYKYIIKRLLMLIPVIIGVTFIVFFILNLSPGDPAAIILGDQASAEALAMKREELGLNEPLLIRYGRYLVKMLHGDLGTSYKNSLSVWDQVISRFPNTAMLAVAAILVALAIGIPVGIISAKNQYSALDNISMVTALIGVSMPSFWMGLLLVIVFALNLGWLPSQGMGQGLVPLLKSLVLPAVTLGTSAAATITRMTRSSMLEVIRQDYIDTARAKGVSEKIITYRHMLKNAMIPIITAVGLQFGTLLGGAMLTETVFSWPGLGRLMVEAIKSKDIPLVLGSVIFLAVMFTVVNLAVDIVYAFVDPRIKSQYKRK
jgi:peptide/nickel transport system permease protein